MGNAVVVHAIHGRLLATLDRISQPASVIRAADLSQFIRGASAAQLGVAGASEDNLKAIARLSKLHCTAPLWPLVVVAPLTPKMVGFLEEANLLRTTFWAEDDERRLEARVRAALRADVLNRAAEVLCGRATSSIVMQRLIKAALLETPPPRSIASFARSQRIARSTVHEYWVAAFGSDTTPAELLEWGKIMRAERSLRVSPVSRVALNLGLHRRTLERMVLRRLSLRLSELPRESLHARRSFRRWVRRAAVVRPLSDPREA